MANSPTHSTITSNWIIPLLAGLVALAAAAFLLLRLTQPVNASFSPFTSKLFQSISDSLASLSTSFPQSMLESLESFNTTPLSSPTPQALPSPSPSPTLTPTPRPYRRTNQLSSPQYRQPTNPPHYPANPSPTANLIPAWPTIKPGELGSPEWQAEFEKRYQQLKQEIETNRQSVLQKNQEFTDRLTETPFPN